MFDERPFAPTARKRQQAKEEGRVPRGRDLTPVAVVLSGLLLAIACGPLFASQLGQIIAGDRGLSWSLDAASGSRVSIPLDGPEFAVEVGRRGIFTLLRFCVPVLALFLGVAVVSQWAQVGGMWLPSRVAPDWQRVDPFQGMQRLVSADRWADSLFAIGRLIVSLAVVLAALWMAREDLFAADESFRGIGEVALQSLWIVVSGGVALAVIAVLDYGVRWWIYEGQLRMTAEEMREELRGQQSDLRVNPLQDGGQRKKRQPAVRP